MKACSYSLLNGLSIGETVSLLIDDVVQLVDGNKYEGDVVLANPSDTGLTPRQATFSVYHRALQLDERIGYIDSRIYGLELKLDDLFNEKVGNKKPTLKELIVELEKYGYKAVQVKVKNIKYGNRVLVVDNTKIHFTGSLQKDFLSAFFNDGRRNPAKTRLLLDSLYFASENDVEPYSLVKEHLKNNTGELLIR